MTYPGKKNTLNMLLTLALIISYHTNDLKNIYCVQNFKTFLVNQQIFVLKETSVVEGPVSDS